MIWKPTVGYSVFKINEIEDTISQHVLCSTF